MELWNSRTPHNSLMDLVTTHWDYAAEKGNMSPSDHSPSILLVSAASKARASDYSHLPPPSNLMQLRPCLVGLIPELLLQGNVGKYAFESSSLCTTGRHTGGPGVDLDR